MNEMILDLKSLRARKARLARLLNKGGGSICSIGSAILLAIGLYSLFLGNQQRIGFTSLSLAALFCMVYLWYRYELRDLHAKPSATTLHDMLDAKLLATLKAPLAVPTAWDIASRLPEAIFLCNHLLISPQLIRQALETDQQTDMAAVWRQAATLTATGRTSELHAGILAAAILLTSPTVGNLLVAAKIRREDILETIAWLQRQLGYIHAPKPYFGGIGRDWAAGFTPTLEHFGDNISKIVEAGGLMPYAAHTDLLDGITHSLSQGNAVALVGQDGTGKSSLVHLLAQHLLTQPQPQLQYYQVISLNASQILSTNRTQLERLMLTLFSEAVAAGNIIIFLDDAQLFFGSGLGAFDMSQVLQPVLKNRRVKIIAAFTPAEWQSLQAQHSALATSFASFAVQEPPEAAIMSIAEDTALILEHQSKVLISYEAIREAYRLSGQFMQEQAFPGKLVTLLEQSVSYAGDTAVVTAQTVQTAIEKMKGVRVSQAEAPEADMLLHLEDRIHERMINQKRAVNVVAAALRRGRAGVSSPKRPVGSFLFLGPTGVGKTELARSLAAVYYGDEQQMIRLDMSEYQRPEDVSRLLAVGNQQEQSLLLAIRQQPFSVVLFDEIEKAHPAILNLFLQLLDEGQLTDEQGKPASFRSSIIIATSNAGATDISARVQAGSSLEDFERPLIDKLIAEGQFKPELINRFDEVVLFRPLTEDELALVAQVMLRGVNDTLAPQHISVQLTPEALQAVVREGYDPEFGARPMRRVIQKTVENIVAVKILEGHAHPGDTIVLTLEDVTGHETATA